MDPFLFFLVATGLFATLRTYTLNRDGFPVTLGNIFFVGPFYKAAQVIGFLFLVTGGAGLVMAGICASLSNVTTGHVLYSERIGQSFLFTSPLSGQRPSGHYDWPVIGFQVGRQNHTFHSFLTWRGHFKTGQTVRVLYMTKHPEHAWLLSVLTLTPLEVFLVGCLLFRVGLENEANDFHAVQWK